MLLEYQLVVSHPHFNHHALPLLCMFARLKASNRRDTRIIIASSSPIVRVHVYLYIPLVSHLPELVIHQRPLQ